MYFAKVIEQLTNEFILHWNHQDMVKLAACLSSNIVVCSPKVFPTMKAARIEGKEKVMEYWSILNKEYFFQMTLLEFEQTANGISCVIDIHSTKVKLYVLFVMNEYGKFCYMDINYR